MGSRLQQQASKDSRGTCWRCGFTTGICQAVAGVMPCSGLFFIPVQNGVWAGIGVRVRFFVRMGTVDEMMVFHQNRCQLRTYLVSSVGTQLMPEQPGYHLS